MVCVFKVQIQLFNFHLLLLGYQRRFDPHIAATKNLAEKVLGNIQLLRVTSRDHPPPPEEYLQAASTGSFFDDFSTHDVVSFSFFSIFCCFTSLFC